MTPTLSSTRVLVTGGAGAIGHRLASHLLSDKHKVTVIDDLSSGHSSNLPSHPGLTFVRGSVCDDRSLTQAFKNRPEYVFHLAALFANQNSIEHPFDDLAVNGHGTLKLLEMSRLAKVRRFIYVSSSCVYGNSLVDIREDSPIRLETPYAITKMLGEQYVSFYRHQYGLDCVTLRYFNSYGPGEWPGKYRNVIPRFIALALNKQPLSITGTGQEIRDFTFVTDTVRGTMSAATAPHASGEIINIGTGKQTSIADLATLINTLTANTSGIVYQARRDWDHVTRRVADISKAARLLDYRPSTTIAEGIGATIEWFTRTQWHGSTLNVQR